MIYRATADRAEVLAWLADRLDMTPRDLVWTYPYELLAVRRDGRLIGAVLYIHWRGASVEAHWAGEPGWLTRAVLRAMFAFAFHVLGVGRITVFVNRGNAAMQSIAVRLGFTNEGAFRSVDRAGDVIIFGMLQHECRWVESDHGTIQQGQRAEIRRIGGDQRADYGEQHRLQAVG